MEDPLDITNNPESDTPRVPNDGALARTRDELLSALSATATPQPTAPQPKPEAPPVPPPIPSTPSSKGEETFLSYAQQAQEPAIPPQEPRGEDEFISFANEHLEKIPTLSPEEEERERRRQAAIRTYHSDLAETIKGKNLSLTNIAVAEQERGTHIDTPSEHRPMRTIGQLLNILASIVLIAAGLGVLIFFYGQWKSTTTPTPPVRESEIVAGANRDFTIPSITTAKERGTPWFVEQLRTFITTSASAPGNIVTITVLEEGSDELLSSEFLELLGARIDDGFMRSLDADMTLGVQTFDTGNQPFLILKTTLFENAFAGMLAWEDTMRDDLVFMFEENTGSPYLVEDILVRNKNVRALTTADGTVVLVYTFFDQNTIVIAASTHTLQTLLERLTIVRFEE